MAQENAWHALSTEEIFRKLETSARGLTTAEAEKRLSKHGPNELEEEKRITKQALLAHQCARNGDIVRAQTLGFTTMAMFQVFNSLNCRSRTKSVFRLGLLSNKYLCCAIAASVSLQVLATILPPLKFALGTTTVSTWDWLTIILVSSSVFFADEIRKFVRSRVKG